MALFGLDLAVPAAALVAEGRLTQEEVDRLLSGLTAASEDGSFFAYGTMVVAAGRVPSA